MFSGLIDDGRVPADVEYALDLLLEAFVIVAVATFFTGT